MPSDFLKIVVSGHVIETYHFEKVPNIVKKNKNTDEKSDLEWIQDIKGDRKQNARKKRWEFIRLVNMNFTEHSKFLTLTFAENVTDLDQAHTEFDKFNKRMRRKYGDYKYAAVVEFQKRGAVHYHTISNLPYIPKDELARIWRQGFVRINDIAHVDNVGAYLSKYMTKENADIRLRGRKSYFASKGLDRPLILKGEQADIVMDMYQLETKKEVYASCYESEHHGLITYKQYNLKRLSQASKTSLELSPMVPTGASD